MKMLLLGSGGSPYIASLIAVLEPHGFEIDLIDPYLGWFRAAGEREKNFYRGGENERAALNQWQRASALKGFLRGRHYDVCNVHYNSAFYGLIPNAIRDAADRLVVSIWGSDLHASSSMARLLQRRLPQRAAVVTINNPDRKFLLEDTFGLPDSKVQVAFMPLGTLSAIDEKFAAGATREIARERLGFPPDRPLLLCGTNARPEQRHEDVLTSLEQESARSTDSLLGDAGFVVPLTYSAQSNRYIDSVIARAESSPLDVRCLTDFLSDDELILLRLAVDGVIQVQRHDMFSGVMQEALYAGSWVLTGSWLPYDFLRGDVASLHVVDKVDEVGRRVAELLEEGATIQATSGDRKKIRDIAGREATGKAWARILRGK